MAFCGLPNRTLRGIKVGSFAEFGEVVEALVTVLAAGKGARSAWQVRLVKLRATIINSGQEEHCEPERLDNIGMLLREECERGGES